MRRRSTQRRLAELHEHRRLARRDLDVFAHQVASTAARLELAVEREAALKAGIRPLPAMVDPVDPSIAQRTHDEALIRAGRAETELRQLEEAAARGWLPRDPLGHEQWREGHALRSLIGTAPRRGHRIRTFVRYARRGGGRPRARAARTSASSGGGDPGPGGDPEPPGGHPSEPGRQHDLGGKA